MPDQVGIALSRRQRVVWFDALQKLTLPFKGRIDFLHRTFSKIDPNFLELNCFTTLETA